MNAIRPLDKKESIWHWFKMPKFYLFGVCYMSVRIYTNLFGTILPFYLTDVLGMVSKDKDKISFNIALVPMIIYGASVATSTQLNKFYDIFGRKKALFFGTAICIGCLAVLAFLQASASWVIYILSLFIGTNVSNSRCFSVVGVVDGDKSDIGRDRFEGEVWSFRVRGL